MLCAGLLYAIASPYVVVNRLQQAVTNNDPDTLVEYIDFPLVRQNLKDQLNAAMVQNMMTAESENPLAAFGLMFGGALVEQMVDTLLTPAGLIQLMQRAEPDPQAPADPVAADDTTVDMAYQSWNRFDVVITSPPNTVTVVLQRSGLWDWRVTEIRLPLSE